jgi:hypothetical protein
LGANTGCTKDDHRLGKRKKEIETKKKEELVERRGLFAKWKVQKRKREKLSSRVTFCNCFARHQDCRCGVFGEVAHSCARF